MWKPVPCPGSGWKKGVDMQVMSGSVRNVLLRVTRSFVQRYFEIDFISAGFEEEGCPSNLSLLLKAWLLELINHSIGATPSVVMSSH